MNRQPVLSVIMPIYNPGSYLHTSMKEILNQSYHDFELICIDDNSTDDSKRILSEYARLDQRVQVYENRENLGAGETRNRGLELAQGEFVFFVDADDVFEPELLKRLVSTAIKTRSDIVYVNYDTFREGDRIPTDRRTPYYYFGKVFQNYTDISRCPKEFIRTAQLAPYSKLYERKFLLNDGIRFQSLKSSNDVYFGLISTLLARKITHVEEYSFYIHVREHGGTYRISNSRTPKNNYLAYLYLKDEMKRRGIWESYGTLIQERFLDNAVYEILSCDRQKGKEYYQFLNESGFQEMQICEKYYYEKLDSVYKLMINRFRREAFESGWYKKIGRFQTLIEENSEKLETLFQELSIIHGSCGVWGAGENGGLLAEFCNSHRCELAGFTDRDTRKWGSILAGYPILGPYELAAAAGCIVVINQDYFNDIYDQLRRIRKGIVLVSLDMCLKYKADIEASSITT